MIVLEKRPAPSRLWSFASPLLAIALAALAGMILFAAMGRDPLSAMAIYFLEPLSSAWSLEELAVKATPLVLIGCGLAVAYRANVWNIGAEGQLVAGAIAGSAIPVLMPGWNDPTALIAMLLLGMLGGALWGVVPALLKTRFNVNEILSSLMLVYVAQLLLDWLVRGPWRDPMGFNFPKSAAFEGWHVLPAIAGRVHLGAPLALLTVAALWLVMARSRFGFAARVLGAAPRAGRFAGFPAAGMTWATFLLSGALAGLAGIAEAAGSIGQLQPSISPGYGFTAIIVAFLGRLSAPGVLAAALLLAVTYLGGEAVQLSLGLSAKVSQAFQGLLLFFVLAGDVLVNYRPRWRRAPAAGAGGGAAGERAGTAADDAGAREAEETA
ncbi:MAG TPA: ABC transporter permease [Thermopetrobacter sp.]|nr:ABC transporter permease [Thermopetrobacter sp.]